MDHVETEGDTIDQAIEKALKVLAVERDKVTVDILSEGKRGILGFGAQKARIRASLRGAAAHVRTPEPQAAALGQAKAVLMQILNLMGIDASIEVKVREAGDETILEIHADRSGLLIGRKGQTLEALQYLVTRIVGERQGSEGPHIIIDVENYRERRRKTLQDMALRLGEKAKRQRKTVTVEALGAADRRIIHAALQDDPWVTTKSLGQGAYRRLLIIPEGDRKKRDDGGASNADKQPKSQKEPNPGSRNPAA